MINKGKMRKDALKYHTFLLNSKVLALDPASYNTGYAVFDKGEKITSGNRKFTGASVFHRLPKIYEFVKGLVEEHGIELLVVEQIRTTSRQGRSEEGTQLYRFFASSHLLLAVGAACAAAKSDVMEMPATSWKIVARRLELAKSDENDAICIGMRAIELAQEELDKWNKLHKKG